MRRQNNTQKKKGKFDMKYSMDNVKELSILVDNILAKAQNDLVDAPEGRIRSAINKKRNYIQYYHIIDKSDCAGKYINKKNIDLAKALAQKKYAQNVVKKMSRMKELLCELQEFEMEDIIFNSCLAGTEGLISLYLLSDEEYLEKWKNKNNKIPRNSIESDVQIWTENNEIVRSKSEKIIADKLKSMNIPYKYEEGVKLKNGKIVYPDFTVLNMRTRKEVYWEHFGMMSKLEYCENTLKKIEEYNLNGKELGEGLVCTFESLNHQLNYKVLDELIRKYMM